MNLEFCKYHGTGNDFILIDNRLIARTFSQEEVARLCDRHFGIGADGLMLLNEEEGYDFGMTYYNCDGNESTMCGNGGRCMTAFAHALGISGRHARFLAADGEHSADILGITGDETQVSLQMKDVSVEASHADHLYLDTGSPHHVVFVEHADQVDVIREARKIRYDTCYAEEGTNVDFVEKEGHRIYVRSYERGVENETLSCGTGVTASALASAIKDPLNEGFYEVRTKGGLLTVRFRKEGSRFTRIRLEGPAMFVFRGETKMDL